MPCGVDFGVFRCISVFTLTALVYTGVGGNAGDNRSA